MIKLFQLPRRPNVFVLDTLVYLVMGLIGLLCTYVVMVLLFTW